MTKTKAVRRWVLRHNLSHLYYACKFGHWKLVRSMLFGGGWVRVKDVKLGSVHPHDMDTHFKFLKDIRGIPITSLFEDEYDKDTATKINWILSERKLSDYVDGGDDE